MNPNLLLGLLGTSIACLAAVATIPIPKGYGGLMAIPGIASATASSYFVRKWNEERDDIAYQRGLQRSFSRSLTQVGYEGLLRSAAKLQPQQQQAIEAEILPELPTAFQPTPIDTLLDALSAVLICGDMGSGKSSCGEWLLSRLTQQNPAEIYVCDPHYDDRWARLGIPEESIIYGIEHIEEFCRVLLKELDDRLERKKKRQPIGNDVIVLLDEGTSYGSRFSDEKLFPALLRRLSTEPRKFNLSIVLISHTPNGTDMGTSGRLMDNFTKILLRGAAMGIAKNNWKRTDPEFLFLQSQAYPAILAGAIQPTVTLHPTHGEYTSFRIKGNAPRNIGMVNCLPPTLTIASTDNEIVSNDTPQSAQPKTIDNLIESLERSYQAPVAIDLSRIPVELHPIVNYSLKYGTVKAIDIKRNVKQFKDVSTSDIRRLFLILDELGCGSVEGEGDFLRYRAA